MLLVVFEPFGRVVVVVRGWKIGPTLVVSLKDMPNLSQTTNADTHTHDATIETT